MQYKDYQMLDKLQASNVSQDYFISVFSNSSQS